MIVELLLDGAESYLHDLDNSVWPRAELLRLLNDGYRLFTTQSLPTVRIFQLDVPARCTGAGSQEWEDVHVAGQFSRFTQPSYTLNLQCTYRWENEVVGGGEDPANSYDCVTYDWERSLISNNVDNHFRFVLAKTHERPRYAFWGDKRLGSRAVTELDLRDQRWWVESGEPIIYLNGLGRELSFELFEVETTYTQAYYLQDFEQGIPRLFTSDASRTYEVTAGVDRWDYAYSGGQDYLSISGLGYKFTSLLESTYNHTHSWEADLTEDEDADSAYVTTFSWEIEFTGNDQIYLGLGPTRGLSSADRQYLPMAYDAGTQHVGSARDFHSSESSISIFEHTVPGRDLTESDEPALIPTQLHKFLKYYVIGTALSSPGEGYRPDLAQHWLSLFQLGVGFLATLATPSFAESNLARGQVNEVRVPTPPRVRLPSSYPRSRGR